jgi:hypothetical protein
MPEVFIESILPTEIRPHRGARSSGGLNPQVTPQFLHCESPAGHQVCGVSLYADPPWCFQVYSDKGLERAPDNLATMVQITPCWLFERGTLPASGIRPRMLNALTNVRFWG